MGDSNRPSLAKGSRSFSVVPEVTVTVTVGLLVAKRQFRAGVLIQNKSATIDIFIGENNAVTGASDGFRIEAGKSFFLDSQAEVWAITAADTAAVDGLEYHN